MKVYIGPYTNWVGPYQIANYLQKVGVSEERCEKIGDWLDQTWLRHLCNYIYEKRKRKIEVRIDNYDVWGMDETLAHIIVPMLKKLRERKNGSPAVDDADVPAKLRMSATAREALHTNGETDDHWNERWDHVMGEMIFAFESKLNNWESKFSSGTLDISWIPVDYDGNPVDDEDAPLYRMAKGPNDTFKIDWDARKAYQARIDNGLRLFAKYYHGLWD